MPRTKVPKKRTRYQVRLEAEIAERQRLAGVKLDAALQKIDELGKHSKQQVDNQLQLLMARMPQQMLQMKWSDLYKLQLQRFEHLQFKSPAPPPTPRSHSNCSRGRLRTPQTSRNQVQSVDRAGAMLKRDDNLPAVTLLRWPKPGEVALSTGGSPLAVQTFPDRCVNVHIPTKAGVLKLQSQKLVDVKREVLQQLDASTLNQIKTLSSNLHKIVDIATKIQASKK
ncbi:borealin [Drosophila sulfurigaster albostrigata]|uniref:borealin n=1 Tax=Drosophila sulfurigaster albostrigata TaxID=89887 RepID=UPI002D21865B|nr:borealin [Drosophila sulfurigaster albostrigata]